MSKGRRELSAEEKKLWRRVASAVKPRRGRTLDEDAPEPQPPVRASAAKQAPKPTPKPQQWRTPSAPLAAPANRGAEKRVRRGRVEVGATLDLHGHTQESGRAALQRFLIAAHARGLRTVIVVTGVGRGGEGVLKQRLPDWLAQPELRGVVSGFAQAHRSHGGAGAYYVFLKRPETR
ncbi:MAG: Smr/MutS family protein [Hyphomonadaceae bacterium]